MTLLRILSALFAAAMVLLASGSIAAAHPHVWITVRSQLIFGADGAVQAVQHQWTFDEAYSDFAIRSLDKDQDGMISPEELKNVSVINKDALESVNYFTFMTLGGQRVALSAGDDHQLDYAGRRLTLRFSLRPADPVPADRLLVRIYDPSYFISLTLVGSEDAISAVSPPANCTLLVTRPESVDEAKRIVPDAVLRLMKGGATYGEKFANEARVNCA